MDPIEPPRSRPGVRGSFDEETCRMRLHEIGGEIVPRYPFLPGIQAIYEILLHEHGKPHIADAISVLHELLEDESYEGHIWRSWRHGWRHRNADILNPFVPAVGDFIFPPPTSKRIRLLKGANFSGSEQETSPPTPRYQPAHDDDRPSYTSSQPPLTLSVENARHVSTGSIIRRKPLPQVEHPEDQHDKIASEQNPTNATEESSKDKVLESTNLQSTKSNNDNGANKDDQISGGTDTAPSLYDADDENDTDSQQEFVQVTEDDQARRDPDLLRFEIMSAGAPSLSAGRPKQSPAPDILAMRPIRSRNLSAGIDKAADNPMHCASDCADGDDHQAEFGGCSSANLERRLVCPRSVMPSEGLLTAPRLAGGGDNRHLLVSDDEELDDECEQLLPDRAYREDVQGMSLSAVKSYRVETASPSFSTVSGHGSLHAWRGNDLEMLEANNRDLTVVNGEVLSLAPRAPAVPTPGRFPIDSPDEDEISHIRSHRCRPNEHAPGVICSRVSCERYPIDGYDEAPSNGRRASMFTNREDTPPNRLLRRGRSLLQHLPRIFRNGEENKQTHHPAASNTYEKGPFTAGSLFRRKASKAGRCLPPAPAPAADPPPQSGPSGTKAAYSLDGAFDEADSLTAMSAVDLNKALPGVPPVPLRSKEKVPSPIRTGTPSVAHSPGGHPRPSTASTESSNLSRVSSKKRFHLTAHELVHPETGGSRDPSPFCEADPDKNLGPPKFDPLASPRMPDTPMTFSSFTNANPFTDQYYDFIPPMPAPVLPDMVPPEPEKSCRDRLIPQSRSEGQLFSPKPFQSQAGLSRTDLDQSDGLYEGAPVQPRGRIASRDCPQVTQAGPSVDRRAAADPPESRKRSRSPVKRFLGMGKSQSMQDVSQEKESNDEHVRKAGLKIWGDRLRHGFMTNTESKATVNVNSSPAEVSKASPSTKSTFPISLPPNHQARVYSEMELMITMTANKFLKAQLKSGRMSNDSFAKVTAQWAHKNRPQVVEFQFDQATQRDLILYNINTFKFHGEANANPLVLNSTMYAWKVMAKEMSVRTFCMPDSVIRKHLHDSHKVLDLLGAGLSTFLTLQEIQVDALKKMAEMQKRRVDKQKKKLDTDPAAGSGSLTGSTKTRKFTPPTPTSLPLPPMSAFMEDDTLFEDPSEG